MFIATFLSPGAFAQSINPSYISIGEGLASSFVKTVLQDSYGLLWIGTDNGLHLYDGYHLTRFRNIPNKETSLQNNDIWGLAEDADRNIWVATEVGVSRYDRKNNTFLNYNFIELFSLSGPNAGRVFNLYNDSKNRLWAAAFNLEILVYNSAADKWEQLDYLKDDSTRTKIESGFALGVTEDSKGRLWVGSIDRGLMYYDDNENIFKSAKINKNSGQIDFTESENTITFLYADPTNVLWITTRNGVYKYKPDSEELITIKEYDYAKTIINNHWNSMLQDDNGNVWIANNFRGILKFDGISDEYSEIQMDGRFKQKNGGWDITLTHSIMDKTGILWFGSTTQGLLKYDPYNKPFDHYSYNETDKKGLSSTQIFGLLESTVHKGKIYVGTRGGALNIFDENEKTFKHVNYSSVDDMFGGSVRSLAEEADGSLWLGTWGDGLVHLNPMYQEIARYTNDSLSFNSLSNNSVRVIKKDAQGNYWIGTNAGLNLLNPRTGKIKRIASEATKVYPQELVDIAVRLHNTNHQKQQIEKVADDQNLSAEFEVIKPRNYLVVSAGEGFLGDSLLYDYGWIVDASNDTIWGGHSGINSFHCGGAIKNRLSIDVIELKPGIYNLRYISDDSHSYGKWNALPPSYPQFWGIQIFELDDPAMITQIKNYLNQSRDQDLIIGNNIRSIHIANNTVWIGTDSEGLTKIDKQKNRIKNYRHNEFVSNSISNNTIQYIYEDKEGMLWLATDVGLNRFDPVQETFRVYTEDDGLPTNYVSSILPGDDNELWISTRNGISKMVTDPETGQITFVNYDTDDGLGGMDFIALVALKSSSGQYYFGGEHGLNVFTPMESNLTPPDLVFTDLKISNRSVKTLDPDDNPLKTSLLETKELTLPHDQNDLTFVFAGLHYSNSAKNQYAHKLIGYDDEWLYDNKREITYTNLDPGEYTFSIKGSNRDGVWNSEGKSLTITIKPPWWFTTWAYIGYGLMFILGVFTIDRVQRKRLLSRARERMRLQEAELRAEAAELQARAAEAERRALESENARKSRELEEARQLQLSMLPRQLPQLPHLDIAVYMQTATEVGGDYYDFHVSLDGTLTVVIGDATGHGMKAGTMVTTAKSLFNSYAPNPDIIFSFHEITRCIKQMNFDKLSMCMTMLKIQGNQLIMSAAGMPPSFIFRRETRSIEEHLLQGMPLGTMDQYPYELKNTKLSPGDTILLISDGLPELKNDAGEMYGYKRVRNAFEDVAEKDPQEIIGTLRDEGQAWMNSKDPEDDVTFVVIKVK